MKKMYLLSFALIMFTAPSWAQRQYTSKPVTKDLRYKLNFSTERLTRDTLMNADWATWSPTIYGVTGGGYILGNNTYGDLAKSQSFVDGDLHPGTAHGVEGAVLWFGGKDLTSGDPTSKVTVKVYQLNATGTNLAGTTSTAPGTILGSVDLLAVDIDTSDYTYVSFASPIFIGATVDYAIGVDFSTLAAGDTAGLVSTADGEVNFPEVVWEKWNTPAWYTLPAAGWGSGTFDVVAGIFAAVDLDFVGVDELASNEIKLSQNQPNPASKNTIINYETASNGNVSLKVFNVAGKEVMMINEGNKTAGKHRINLNTADLSSGVYYYTLTVGENHLSKKMVIIE